jgi:hypothetical protein
MISRNIPLVDKNSLQDPSIQSPITVPGTTKGIQILPDVTKSSLEYAFRGIQNVGSVNLYIGIGFQPDNTRYSFILAQDAAQLNETNITPILSCQAVYAYSGGAGGTVAAFQLYRNDLSQTGNPIRSGQLQSPG